MEIFSISYTQMIICTLKYFLHYVLHYIIRFCSSQQRKNKSPWILAKKCNRLFATKQNKRIKVSSLDKVMESKMSFKNLSLTVLLI